jgi:hypothetical protein
MTPAQTSIRIIGSRRISQIVQKKVRVRTEGNSFGPSDWNLAAASVSESPGSEDDSFPMDEIPLDIAADHSDEADLVPCFRSLNLDQRIQVTRE